MNERKDTHERLGEEESKTKQTATDFILNMIKMASGKSFSNSQVKYWLQKEKINCILLSSSQFFLYFAQCLNKNELPQGFVVTILSCPCADNCYPFLWMCVCLLKISLSRVIQ